MHSQVSQGVVTGRVTDMAFDAGPASFAVVKCYVAQEMTVQYISSVVRHSNAGGPRGPPQPQEAGQRCSSKAHGTASSLQETSQQRSTNILA